MSEKRRITIVILAMLLLVTASVGYYAYAAATSISRSKSTGYYVLDIYASATAQGSISGVCEDGYISGGSASVSVSGICPYEACVEVDFVTGNGVLLGTSTNQGYISNGVSASVPSGTLYGERLIYADYYAFMSDFDGDGMEPIVSAREMDTSLALSLEDFNN